MMPASSTRRLKKGSQVLKTRTGLRRRRRLTSPPLRARQGGTHLFCPFAKSYQALNFLPPRSVYTVGQPDGKHVELKPLPPFGRELIAVMATKQPLVFTPKVPRYDPEPAGLYLDQLRQALPRDLVQVEIAATFYTIETRKTGPENP